MAFRKTSSANRDLGSIDRSVWTVSDLTSRIHFLLESQFADVVVSGEISSISRPSSGHVYLTLKDENAQISAVIWRSSIARTPFELEVGLAVRVYGGVTVYDKKGAYQIIVRKIEPEGVGAFELAFKQLYAKLHAEGLFDPLRAPHPSLSQAHRPRHQHLRSRGARLLESAVQTLAIV